MCAVYFMIKVADFFRKDKLEW